MIEEDAMRLLQKAIMDSPRFYDAHLHFAVAVHTYYEKYFFAMNNPQITGLIEAAAYSMQQCVEIQPELATSHAWSAIIAADLGDFQRCFELASRALDLDSQNFDANHQKGKMMMHIATFEFGKMNGAESNEISEEATEYLETAHRSCPDEFEPPLLLGHAYLYRAQHHYDSGDEDRAHELFEQSLASFKKATALPPDAAYHPQQMAIANFMCGHTMATIVRLLSHRIDSAAQHGLRLESIKRYGATLELMPDYLDAFTHRSMAYEGLDRMDLALDDLDAALNISPDDAGIREMRENLLAKMQGN